MVAALKAPLPGPQQASEFGAMANLPGVAQIGQLPAEAPEPEDPSSTVSVTTT
jgi:hypothetical protein